MKVKGDIHRKHSPLLLYHLKKNIETLSNLLKIKNRPLVRISNRKSTLIHHHTKMMIIKERADKHDHIQIKMLLI